MLGQVYAQTLKVKPHYKKLIMNHTKEFILFRDITRLPAFNGIHSLTLQLNCQEANQSYQTTIHLVKLKAM